MPMKEDTLRSHQVAWRTKGWVFGAEPVTSVDYLPTIAEMAGIQLPDGVDIDGYSLVNHLKSSGRQSIERDAIYWHFPHYRHHPGPYSIIRKGPWKLIKFYAGPFELYNLTDDISEKNNLASTMPEKVRTLDAQLLTHLKSIGAKLPKLNPEYKSR